MLNFHLMADNVSASPVIYGPDKERWAATIFESQLQILLNCTSSELYGITICVQGQCCIQKTEDDAACPHAPTAFLSVIS